MDIVGIEFELRASPWDGGFVSLDVGRLKASYGKFESFDPDSPDALIDQSSVSIADYSPEWTINATVKHAFQTGNGATLTPMLGMYWQDDYDFEGGLDTTSNERSLCFTPGYAKFRARATYMPADGNWTASVFGQLDPAILIASNEVESIHRVHLAIVTSVFVATRVRRRRRIEASIRLDCSFRSSSWARNLS